ncbi:hypothetical protein FSARC_5900 [Fusarium sarcochroum]|uniref:Clr5 domain-containing protein n=1 Tax=Fusarium sarcochroum TaxID=1208366 RepID=A0A8H4X9X0_9HYPO|nr:hypothetical protein FSARC_5900 [Fusarium sarcochroum]
MPAIPRKSPEEWESVRNLIQEYFVIQNETLNKTMGYMKDQHGFTATQKEYRRRLAQWDMRKNLPKDAWHDIGEENVNGKKVIRGISVSSKRIKRSVSSLFTFWIVIIAKLTQEINAGCIYLASNSLLWDEHMDDFLRWICEIGAVLRLNEFLDNLINKLQENSKATTEIFLFHLLRSAVSLQLEGLVYALLKKGVNPNQSCNKSALDHSDSPVCVWETPLQVAVSRENTRICRILLNCKADVDATALFRKMPPLFIAVAVGHGNLEITNILIKSGSDVNCWSDGFFSKPGEVEKSGLTYRDGGPNRSVLMEAVARQNIEITQLLLDHGARVHDVSTQLGSVLQIAVRTGDVKMVRLLLDNGAHLESVEAIEDSVVAMAFDGSSLRLERLEDTKWILGQEVKLEALRMPIEITAYRDDLGMVKFLLRSGAGTNHQHPDWDRVWNRILGPTLAHNVPELKYKLGRPWSIWFQASEGADVNAPASPDDGLTAVEAAALTGNSTLMAQLVEAGATSNTRIDGVMLHVAARKGFESDVDNLLKRNVDADTTLINQSDPRLRGSVLQSAIRGQRHLIVRKLLDHPIDMNAVVEEETAICTAVRAKALGILKILLDNGANPNFPGVRVTPLALAASMGSMIMVEMLLDAGADVDQLSYEYCSRRGRAAKALGWTVWIWAETRFQKLLTPDADQIVSLLLENGADSNEADSQLEYPIELVARLRANGLLTVLLDNGVDVDAPSSNPRLEWAFTDWKSPKNTFYMPNKSGQVTSKIISASKEPPDVSILLALAVKMRYLTWAETLLEECTNINSTCESGSPLAWACKRGRIELIKMLLEKGADLFSPLPFIAEFMGYTSLLQIVAARGEFNVVRLLLDHGAKDRGGKGFRGSALQIAVRGGLLDIAFLLLREDDEPRTLQSRCMDAAKEAAANGHLILAQKLREDAS